MNNIHFTRGPWKRSENFYPGVFIVSNGGVVAEVATRDDGALNANARLIAAAPDLFDALHKLICSVQPVDNGREWLELRDARAALAKAQP